MKEASLLAVLLAVLAPLGLGCPHEEFIAPCSCKPAVYGLHVVCSGMKSVVRLQNVLKALKDYKIGTLLLHELTPDQELPSDVFAGMNIILLRFVASDVKFGTDGPALRGLEQTLNNLDISKGQLHTDHVQLALLTSLQELYVAQMEVPEIRVTWLGHNQASVRTLKLEKVELRKVHDGAFSKLESLEHLSLSNNRLEEVGRKMLPNPASNLKSMDLSENELSVLPEDFFVNMPMLTSVILTGNDIETLPERTWMPVWPNLNKLLLIDLPLVCDDRLNWIAKDWMPESLTGKCAAPEKVRGMSIVDFLTRDNKYR